MEPYLILSVNDPTNNFQRGASQNWREAISWNKVGGYVIIVQSNKCYWH